MSDLQDHTKDELAAAAAVEGVEVKSKDTKAEIIEKLEHAHEHAAPGATHAHPGNHGQFIIGTQQRRSDEDAILGSFVDVVDGEHQGRFGHFFDVVESDSNGFPVTALVRTRDSRSDVLSLPYESLRPSERAGGR